MVFGLDTKLFGLNDGSAEGEKVDWEKLAGKGAGWHGDEIEVRGVWRGGKRLGGSHGDGHGHQHSHGHDQETNGVGTEHREKRHKHEDKLVRNHVEGEVHQDGKGHQYAPDEGASTSSTNEDEGDSDAGEVVPLEREVLEKELDKLNFEIYRGEPFFHARQHHTRSFKLSFPPSLPYLIRMCPRTRYRSTCFSPKSR